ncbi:proton channel OtopLc-like [Glandiceps talaboti]
MASRSHWLFSPLLTGRENSHSPRDGRISSILFTSNLVTFSVVFIITSRMMTGERESILDNITLRQVQIFLSIALLLATSIMLWFIIFGSRKYISWLHEDKSCDGNSQAHFTLDLIGVYIFGTGKIVLELLELFASFECITVAHYISNLGDYTAGMLFYAIRLTNQLTEMLFLGKYSRATFHNCTAFRYCIQYLLSVNLLLWFYTIADESEEMFSPKSHSGPHFWQIHNISIDPSTLELIEQCINHTTQWQTKMKKVDRVLFPFCLEYSLVAANILCHVWTSMKFLTAAKENSEGPDDTGGEPQTPVQKVEEQVSLHQQRGDNFVNNNNTDHKEIDDVEDGGLRDNGVVVRTTENESPVLNITEGQVLSLSNTRTATQQTPALPGCGIGCIAGIFMMAFMVLISALQQQNYMPSSTVYLYYITKITYFFIMTVLCWVGFDLIQTQTYEHRPYSGEDALLIIPVIGELCYMYFKAIAAVGMMMYSDSDVDVACLLLFEKIMTGIQVWVQTTFLIAAVRHRPRCLQKVGKIREIVVCLLFCNLGFWIKSSFLDQLDFGLSPVEIEFYRTSHEWALIMHILLPFCIFYRFHSVIMCCGIYGRFREPPNTIATNYGNDVERRPILVTCNVNGYNSLERTFPVQ